jgi:hypothetical protein
MLGKNDEISLVDHRATEISARDRAGNAGPDPEAYLKQKYVECVQPRHRKRFYLCAVRVSNPGPAD